MPNKKPMAAGTTENFPMSSLISMAGMSNDHTEAATITPEANPRKAFCTHGFSSFFTKNTQAAPSVVPIKGSMIPQNTLILTTSLCFSSIFQIFTIISQTVQNNTVILRICGIFFCVQRKKRRSVKTASLSLIILLIRFEVYNKNQKIRLLPLLQQKGR